jgi:hypothetical protein
MKAGRLALVLCALMVAAPAPVHADESTTPAARATLLYKEANALYDGGKLEEAEKLYRQAWALSKSYDIASNLGAVAFDRGKYRDAAEYLSFALATFPAGGKPAERASIEAALKKAKENVATVKLRTGVSSAQVSIDGASIGEVADGAEVFVDPGKHTIAAIAKDHDRASRAIEVKQGEASTVDLTMTRSGPEERSKVPAFVMGGVGAASLVAGAVLLGVSTTVLADAKAQRDALVAANGRQVCDGAGAPAQCAQVQTSLQSAQDMGNAGASLLIGAGLVGAGSLIYVLVARPKSPPPVEAALLVAPEHAGVVLRGRF